MWLYICIRVYVCACICVCVQSPHFRSRQSVVTKSVVTPPSQVRPHPSVACFIPFPHTLTASRGPFCSSKPMGEAAVLVGYVRALLNAPSTCPCSPVSHWPVAPLPASRQLPTSAFRGRSHMASRATQSCGERTGCWLLRREKEPDRVS